MFRICLRYVGVHVRAAHFPALFLPVNSGLDRDFAQAYSKYSSLSLSSSLLSLSKDPYYPLSVQGSSQNRGIISSAGMAKGWLLIKREKK